MAEIQLEKVLSIWNSSEGPLSPGSVMYQSMNHSIQSTPVDNLYHKYSTWSNTLKGFYHDDYPTAGHGIFRTGSERWHNLGAPGVIRYAQCAYVDDM